MVFLPTVFCVKLSYQSCGSLKFHTFFALCICFLVYFSTEKLSRLSTPDFFLNFFCCHTHSKEMRLVLTWWWKFAQLICSKTRKERLRKQIKRRKNSEALALLCRFCLVITNANFNGHKTANYTDYQS